MAFQIVLALIPGTIVLVAFASELRWETLSTPIVSTSSRSRPDRRPTSSAMRSVRARRGVDTFGLGGTQRRRPALLLAGTTAFGQVERTANRIYGIEADRPSHQKYALAAIMMLTAGTLVVLYFLVIGMGATWVDDGDSAWATAWVVRRWPLGIGFLAGAFSIVFKVSPRRHQPRMPWLAVGALISVAGCLIVSLLLTLYLNASEAFGETYGPLAGFMGVLLWAYGSSIALFFGLAFAAQLEAVRAGRACTTRRGQGRATASPTPSWFRTAPRPCTQEDRDDQRRRSCEHEEGRQRRPAALKDSAPGRRASDRTRGSPSRRARRPRRPPRRR